MQAADLEKDCMFVLGVWEITLQSFFSGTGLFCRIQADPELWPGRAENMCSYRTTSLRGVRARVLFFFFFFCVPGQTCRWLHTQWMNCSLFGDRLPASQIPQEQHFTTIFTIIILGLFRMLWFAILRTSQMTRTQRDNSVRVVAMAKSAVRRSDYNTQERRVCPHWQARVETQERVSRITMAGVLSMCSATENETNKVGRLFLLLVFSLIRVKKGKRQERPGMNFDGSRRTGLHEETLSSTPYGSTGSEED